MKSANVVTCLVMCMWVSVRSFAATEPTSIPPTPSPTATATPTPTPSPGCVGITYCADTDWVESRQFCWSGEAFCGGEVIWDEQLHLGGFNGKLSFQCSEGSDCCPDPWWAFSVNPTIAPDETGPLQISIIATRLCCTGPPLIEDGHEFTLNVQVYKKCEFPGKPPNSISPFWINAPIPDSCPDASGNSWPAVPIWQSDCDSLWVSCDGFRYLFFVGGTTGAPFSECPFIGGINLLRYKLHTSGCSSKLYEVEHAVQRWNPYSCPGDYPVGDPRCGKHPIKICTYYGDGGGTACVCYLNDNFYQNPCGSPWDCSNLKP